MPESPEPEPAKTPTPKKRKQRAQEQTVFAPEPAPLVDFGDPIEPVQDETEVDAQTPEPVASTGGAPTPESGVQSHLSPFLVGMAKGFGLSDAELKDMSQKEVERYVQFAHRRENWIAENVLRNNPGTAPAPAVAPSAAQPQEVTDDLDLGLDDTYPDEIKSALKKVAKAKDKEIAELKAMVKDLHQVTKGRKQQELFSAFDEAFTALGKPYEEHFGSGTISGGEITQEQALKRQYVTMAISEDDSPAEAKKKIASIVKLLYGNGKIEAPPEKGPTPLEIAKKDYAEGTVPKPIQRDPAKAPFGAKRAEKALEQEMIKRGMLKYATSSTNGDSDDTKL